VTRRTPWRRLTAVCLGALVWAASPARAAPPASPVPPYDVRAAERAATVTDPRAATRAYLDAVPAERRARTKAYANGDHLLDVAGSLLSAAILLGLVATRAAALLRDRLQRLTRRRALQAALFWTVLLTAFTVLRFPLTLYRSYIREKAYGLLTQSLGGWLGDQLKALAVGCVLGSVLVIAVYTLFARSRRWWLWGAALVVAFQVLTNAIFPVFVAPLFYRFTPVGDPQVREAVLDLARRNEVPADEVYEIDASRRTDRISAGVVGLLGTTRVVLFDTTLRRCTLPEIRFIMGHEIGHYVGNHPWKIQAFSALVTLVGFAFARWGLAAAARRPRLGIAGPADIASLPLLWALLGTAVFVLSPPRYALLRALELQADGFGLAASREPDAAATTFLKLGEYRDLEPHPAVEILFFSHPSGRTRIGNAMGWKAQQRLGP
jgi:STE24 endopeptidase